MSVESEMFYIRVPASTANLGPGFDSIGMALGLYLDIQGRYSDKWEVIPLSEELSSFPSDDSNYIVMVAKEVAEYYGKRLRPCRLEISSEIPLARGLGSSASAIVAGIELANIAADLNLSTQEKSRHASIFEGHPDNAAASVMGGLVVGWHSDEVTDVLSFPIEGIKVIAVIPDYELRTEDSRNALPEKLAFKDAIHGSAAANVFLGAVLSGNWPLAGEMMKRDRFHQTYRAHLVPHLPRVEELAKANGAFGTALSGAGPTVLCLVPESAACSVQETLQNEFPDFDVKVLDVDNEGSKPVILSDEQMKPTWIG
ncbi:homoserine kinase [Peribacillus loiseleuriae]|uniref:homoserine kinase n=1 Tax=Peribacillus loiseleuriae TaxID=1679170 RepID=UPI003CFFC58E